MSRTPRTIRRAGLGATLAVAAALASLAVPARAEAATPKLKVVQYNVEKKWEAVHRALKTARDGGAQAITLQEVCTSHLARIEAFHGGAWSVHHDVSRAGACKADGSAHTVAIRTAKGGTGVSRKLTPDTYTDPETGSQHNREPYLTCIRWGSNPIRNVCSAHLALNRSGERDDQIRDVRKITNGFIGKGQLVVVGGDFNARPKDPDMDLMYGKGPGANGKFYEAHQLSRKTTEQAGALTSPKLKTKIDYVFYSQNRTPWPQDGAVLKTLPAAPSDHKLLIATAKVRVG